MPDVMGMVARALARTGDEDWAAAAELWTEVTTANPVNGDYWARLGEARFGARDYAGAREAYEKVLRLGVRQTFLSAGAPPLGCLSHRLLRGGRRRPRGGSPGRTDVQILIGMMKLVRHLDDGHARIAWPQDERELSRMLPVDMFGFTEGLYVIGAAPGCERLLGARVDKIGGLAIDDVMAALEQRWQYPARPASPASPASPHREQAAEPARRAVRHHRTADVLGGAEHRHRHRTRNKRDLRRRAHRVAAQLHR